MNERRYQRLLRIARRHDVVLIRSAELTRLLEAIAERDRLRGPLPTPIDASAAAAAAP